MHERRRRNDIRARHVCLPSMRDQHRIEATDEDEEDDGRNEHNARGLPSRRRRSAWQRRELRAREERDMSWDEHRRLARLAGAGVSAAALASAGCVPAGAAPARHAASLPVASAEPAEQEQQHETAPFRAPPAHAGTSDRLSASAHDSDAEEQRRKVVITGLATTGVTALAGVSFAIVAKVKSIAADDKEAALRSAGGSSACAGGQRIGDCVAMRRLREDTATFFTLSAWSLISAGVVEVATGVYGMATRRSKQSTGVQLSPAIDTAGVAVTVTGAF
jgi:hypothetical protein